ncbi:MAG: hypothetical protein ACE5HL_03755 [Terriglobia bacterium]
MSEWEKVVEKAKEMLQERAFVVESDRELGQQSSLRIIERIGQSKGKTQYKVVEERPQDNWY